MNPISREILDRRPNISYIAPRSTETVREFSPQKSQKVVTLPERVSKLIQGFKNVEVLAEAVEKEIQKKAKDVKVKLNAANPEDFVTMQAAARLFPDKAKEIQPGISVVDEITFDMYNECVQCLKAHGKEHGKANQIGPAAQKMQFPLPTKTDFGGLGQDRRPELNPMSVPVAPIDILSYTVATIPILFGMLYPLIALYVKTSIIGHTHNSTAPGAPTGPGIPLTP